MSLELYPTRLYWMGLRGTAKLNGAAVHLVRPPHLPGLAVDGIDYAPGVVAMVMPRMARWRDMTPDEIAAAEQLLQDLTTQPLGAPPCN